MLRTQLNAATAVLTAWLRWFTFDARHNHPRIGRIVVARGRDAADVAISTAFGPTQLARFSVTTKEIADGSADNVSQAA